MATSIIKYITYSHPDDLNTLFKCEAADLPPKWAVKISSLQHAELSDEQINALCTFALMPLASDRQGFDPLTNDIHCLELLKNFGSELSAAFQYYGYLKDLPRSKTAPLPDLNRIIATALATNQFLRM